MKLNRIFLALLVLFMAAAGVAAYLVWHHYALINGDFAGARSFCSISATIDCDAVNASSYSEVFGIPLSVLGLSYYLFAVLVILIATLDRFAQRAMLLILLGPAAFSGFATLVVVSISAFVLKKLCLMCTALQAINLVTLALVWFALREFVNAHQIPSELKKLGRKKLLTFAAIFVVLLFGTQLMSSQLRRESGGNDDLSMGEFRTTTVVDVPASPASPKLGFQGNNPPVQLVEFSDFQCPACAMAARRMDFLLQRYGSKVQLVFRSFPLDQSCNRYMPHKGHEGSCFAAKAGLCAKEQDKFEGYYLKLFNHGHELGREQVLKLAEEAGMDITKLQTCIASPETAAQIERDIEAGKTLGVQATPTFFVNGRKVEGVIDESRLKMILRELGL